MFKKIKEKIKFLKWAYQNRNMTMAYEPVKLIETEIKPEKLKVTYIVNAYDNHQHPMSNEMINNHLNKMIIDKLDNLVSMKVKQYDYLTIYSKEFMFAPVDRDKFFDDECDTF